MTKQNIYKQNKPWLKKKKTKLNNSNQNQTIQTIKDHTKNIKTIQAKTKLFKITTKQFKPEQNKNQIKNKQNNLSKNN